MRKYYLGVLLMVGFLSIPACEKADPGNNPETPVEKEPAATDDIHGAGDGDSEEVLPPASPEYDDILCGNGKLDPGESCDDGGRLPHDGCNIYCQIERGYGCNTAEPSVCGKICGNGKIDAGEECDDGNTENHDGCDNRCKFEEKFDCSTDSEPTKCYAKEYFGLGTCTNPIYFNGNNLILSGQNFNDAFTDSVAFCADKIDPLQADAVIKTELKKGQMLLISDAAGSNLSFFIIPSYCETASTCLNVKVNQENQYNYYYATQDEIVTAIFSSSTLVDTPYELHIEKVTPVCGDGQFIPLAEECDDGNTDNGDGCDNKCQIEETYICNNENWDGFKRNVSTCTTRCGNNSFDYSYNEECDDGNRIDGDGCSSTCKIEEGYHCVGGICNNDGSWIGNASSCEHPGIMLGDEIVIKGNSFSKHFPISSTNLECTWTNNYNDAVFQIDMQPGEMIEVAQFRLTAIVKNLCTYNQCEQFSHGAQAGLESSSGWQNRYYASKAETIWVFFENVYRKNVGGPESSYDLFIKRYKVSCGDGVITPEAGENCEDGNVEDGDGCDHNCRVETFWSCDNSTLPSVCTVNGTDGSSEPFDPVIIERTENCGDGYVESYEKCDDGNLIDGDGCDANCKTEAGYQCIGDNNVLPEFRCHKECGDGTYGHNEECDDGNVRAGDGCDANCKIEPGYTCFGFGEGSCVRGTLSEGDGDSCETAGVITGNFYGYFEDFAASFTNKLTRTGKTCLYNNASDRAPEAIYKVVLKRGQVLKVIGNTQNMTGTTVSILKGGCNKESTCIGAPLKSSGINYVAEKDEEIYVVLEAIGSNESEWHKPASIYFDIHYPVCGDGLVEGLEQCEKSLSGGKNGCSDTCQVNAGYICDSRYCKQYKNVEKTGNVNSCFAAPELTKLEKISSSSDLFKVDNNYQLSQYPQNNDSQIMFAISLEKGQKVTVYLNTVTSSANWRQRLYLLNSCNEVPTLIGQKERAGTTYKIEYTAADADAKLLYTLESTSGTTFPSSLEIFFDKETVE